MKKITKMKITTTLLLLVMSPLTGQAAGPGGKGPHGPPPQAAITACEGKQVGDSVTFTGRRGESLSATCRSIEGQIAAVPEGMGKKKGRGGQGGPQE